MTRDIDPHGLRYRRSLTEWSDAVGEPTRLWLLGAGSCTDINLSFLAARGHRIVLVDRDRRALERAMISHRRANSVTTLCVEDLNSVTAAKLRDVADDEDRINVVVSACVISQLVMEAVSQCGAAACDCGAITDAVILRHLSLVSDLSDAQSEALILTDHANAGHVYSAFSRRVAVRARDLLEQRLPAGYIVRCVGRWQRRLDEERVIDVTGYSSRLDREREGQF